MRQHGCSNFVFISRSGADKDEAASVVQDLRDSGASVDVYRGDVSDEVDVERIVSEVKKTRGIRGVVHAAMVLQVSNSTRRQVWS
jgi:NAD(P)-dependent dehydrogenase (short-subunit alcohol dehydrogenase family)